MAGAALSAMPVVVTAVGSLTAAGLWILLGWEREDAVETLSRWRAAAVHEAGRLARACFHIVRASGAKLGFGAWPSQEVSLGDVSEMIDIVRLGLQAGLSFDAALGVYCEGRKGRLSDCMARARISWQAGLTTRERGLLDAARDVGLRPLESFAIAVSQALELGAPLADTLESQGREIRSAHRAQVERRVERAPVKLLIPTGTLILPALLLSIVGPLVAAGGLM